VSFPGLLHNPATSTTPRVTLTWDPRFQGTLHIEDSAGTSWDIPARDLSVSQGGWRGDAITFAWQHENQTWAVTVDDQRAIADLATQLPSNLSTQIQSWRKQGRRSARWSTTVFTVGALLTLLPLVVLVVLFLMRDRVLDAVIERMPPSIDAEIGQRLHDELAASGTLVKDGAAVEALRTVSQRFSPHLQGKGFTFRFEVVNDSSVNAFAAPGGLVVIHTGLLAKATSVDQLAGVLSHEITHVTRRHALRQILYDMGLATTLRWLFGMPDGIADHVAGAAANLSGLKFSREQETEADAGGVELLKNARLPASGLQSFMDLLAQENKSIPSFLSTHPAGQERSAALAKVISERGPWPVEPLAIDWDAVRRDAQERTKGK
jgi:predicted Zn-dependent protease